MTLLTANNTQVLWVTGARVLGWANFAIAWASTVSSGGNLYDATPDLFLTRDAAGTLAQRNGANGQTFRIYNTTDSGIANYERAKLEWSSNVFRIGTEKAGTGSARALELQTDGTTRLTIDAGGGVTVQSGTTLQVGSGTSIDINGFTVVGVGKNGFRQSGGGYIIFNADGVLKISNNSDNGFGRLQFGGTTSSFPAIKRNSAALNFRLADDSGDCDITAAKATFSGQVVTATAALATNATSGFLYVPTCAGTPSGTPASQTGTAPIVIDTTNNKLYFYSGGAWRDAGP